jgi:hypothetical protein
MSKRWNYNGDVSLKHGGFYWREDGLGLDDYVLAVRVTPCSDAGGPDNVFHIEAGSIYMPQEIDAANRALACCGYSIDASGTVTDCTGARHTGKRARALLVDAWLAYHGTDRDAEYIVRIGSAEPGARGWCAEEEPDCVLRAGSSLRNYVKREFLRN